MEQSQIDDELLGTVAGVLLVYTMGHCRDLAWCIPSKSIAAADTESFGNNPMFAPFPNYRF